MGRHKRFVDNFWTEDINNTAGFDTLSQRMREGRKLCKDIEEYLRQRAKIEAQYSKDLQKLNKQDNREDLSGLENSWREMKIQTENIAKVHELCAKQFQKLSNEISSFNSEQKKLTKELEDRVSKLHSSARNTYNKVLNQQKVYVNKYDESVNADSTVKYNEKNVSGISPKEMEKSRTKADKAKDDLEKADNMYKVLVAQVQEEMKNWETEMAVLCNTFQDLDEKRIDHLRDYLWQCTNVDSQTNVDHDQCCEHIRISLEKCDIDDDIDNFINKSALGSSHPARVEYKGMSKETKKPSPKPGIERRLPSLPREAQRNNQGHIYASVDYGARVISQRQRTVKTETNIDDLMSIHINCRFAQTVPVSSDYIMVLEKHCQVQCCRI